MDKENFLKRTVVEDRAAFEFIEQWFDEKDYVVAKTSGSTGTPKEIRLPKRLMVASARATNRFFGITSEDILVCPLSANYIAGKMMIVRGLVSGAYLAMLRPTNQPDLSRFEQKIALLPVVPSQIPKIIDQLHNVANLLIGGAAPSRADEQALIAAGVNAWVSYGMTETCSHVALRRIGEEIYRALPGIIFEVDNRNCLIINWDALGAPIVTNDIVELISPTCFRWLGRYDNVINSGGIKVFPEEIERKLSAIIPAGINYYIRPVKHPKWGEAPELVLEKYNISYFQSIGERNETIGEMNERIGERCETESEIIETDGKKYETEGKRWKTDDKRCENESEIIETEGKRCETEGEKYELTAEDILGLARESLTGAERPVSVVTVSEIPRTPNGKILRQ